MQSLLISVLAAQADRLRLRLRMESVARTMVHDRQQRVSHLHTGISGPNCFTI